MRFFTTKTYRCGEKLACKSATRSRQVNEFMQSRRTAQATPTLWTSRCEDEGVPYSIRSLSFAVEVLQLFESLSVSNYLCESGWILTLTIPASWCVALPVGGICDPLLRFHG